MGKDHTAADASLPIPLIDIGPITAGDYGGPAAAALTRAAEQAGFAYIRNHQIPDSVIQQAQTSALAFFQQPASIKSELAISTHHHGWLASGGAQMEDDIPSDRKESFIWGEECEHATEDNQHSLRGPNCWPDQQLPKLRRHANQWFDHAGQLAQALLRAFAQSMKLSTDFFLRTSNRPLSRASFVYYPRQAPGDNHPVNQFGVGPHTDFGVLTILCQDQVGGLEVEGANGQWFAAPPQTDTLLVNVGDLLTRWTNGRLKSVRHRVTVPLHSDRLSLVLAYDPNAETMIDPREIQATGKDCPEPIRCGDYLDWRFARAFAYRR